MHHGRSYALIEKLDIRLGSTDDSAFLVLIIILLFARNVNRTDDISLTIVDIFIVCNRSCSRRSCRSLGLKPLFSDHLTDGVVNSLHRVTVCVGHLLETTVAVLVSVLDESFVLTLDVAGSLLRSPLAAACRCLSPAPARLCQLALWAPLCPTSINIKFTTQSCKKYNTKAIETTVNI